MILVAISIYSLVLGFIALLILVLLLIVLVLLYGIRNYYLFQNRKKWLILIEEKIAIAIFDGVNSIKNDKEINSLMKKSYFKRLFLSVLILSEKKFSGDAQRTLIEIFHSFDLEKLAFNRLHSKNVYDKIRGIQALTSMQVKAAIPEIRNLLNHSDKRVYTEAQHSIVRFNDFGGLEFLGSLDTILSEWQQLRLLKAITEVPEDSYEMIGSWLKSKNHTVLEFVFAILRKFRLFRFHDSVCGLLQAEDSHIRVKAVQTLQALENSNTIDILCESFIGENGSVQVAILHAIQNSHAKNCVPFVKEQFLSVSDVKVRLVAAETLVHLGESDFLQHLDRQNLQEEDSFPQIIDHALALKL